MNPRLLVNAEIYPVLNTSSGVHRAVEILGPTMIFLRGILASLLIPVIIT